MNLSARFIPYLLCIYSATFAFFSDSENLVHPGFELETIHPKFFHPRVSGMEFFKNGQMVISTWRPNEVYLIGGMDGPREKISVRKIADGFKEIMGLCVVNDTIFLADQDSLFALADKDGDGTFETRRSIGAIPYSGSFHEWSFGLVHKNNHFYTGLSVAATQTGKTIVPQKEPMRGSVISIDHAGKVELFATGFRAPEGMCLGPNDELFATDNQGSWLPASKFLHVVLNRTYGHHVEPKAPFEDRYPCPPAVWLPYGEVTRSPTQPAYMTAGPYAGQFFYGDIAMGVIRRVFLEKVKGEYQGCVFRFSGGFEAAVHRLIPGPDGSLYLGCLGNGDQQDWGWAGKMYGLQRLKPSGKTVFEIKAVRSLHQGFEVEFSQPIATKGVDTSRFSAERWWYEPTEAYGGPKKDVTQMRVAAIQISPDGKKIRLNIPDLLPQQVIHIRTRDIRSDDGKENWTPEFWYTLNYIPEK